MSPRRALRVRRRAARTAKEESGPPHGYRYTAGKRQRGTGYKRSRKRPEMTEPAGSREATSVTEIDARRRRIVKLAKEEAFVAKMSVVRDRTTSVRSRHAMNDRRSDPSEGTTTTTMMSL